MTEADTPAIIKELERVFDVLNEKLFDGKLVRVPFLLQVKKKVSIRWFPDTAAMILGSDFTNLEYADLPCQMLHEMIHVYNHQKGVNDCTTNQYHNKHFLTMALSVGLVVIKHKTQGWAITTTLYPRNVVEREYISKPLKEAIQRRIDAFASVKLDKMLYKQARSEMRTKVKEEKPKTYFLKYVCNCPPPHNSIRSGRRPDGQNALNLKCMNCHSLMVCVSVPEEEDQ